MDMIPNTVEALISLEASNDVPVVLLGTATKSGPSWNCGSVFVATAYHVDSWTCSGYLGELDPEELVQHLTPNGVRCWQRIWPREDS